MAGNERFDDSIGRWLEETAPDRLPRRVLAATFERTRRTRQEPAWRTVLRRPQMPRFIPVLGGAAIVVISAVLALNVASIPGPGGQATGSPSATATPGMSPQAADTTFTSTTHEISIDYPSDWQVRPATELWNHEILDFDAPGVDVLYHPTLKEDLYIALVSEPLDGQAPRDWCCSPVIEGTDFCGDGDGVGGGHGGGYYLVDGAEDGFGVTMGCPGGGDRHSLVVATESRGYIIVLDAGNGQLAAAYDWEWFKAVLETVKLRP